MIMQWNLLGICSGLMPVGDQNLALFARLYDEPCTPAEQARLPVLHSLAAECALEKFSSCTSAPWKSAGESYFPTQMWDETYAVKKDGHDSPNYEFPARSSEADPLWAPLLCVAFRSTRLLGPFAPKRATMTVSISPPA